MKADDVLWVYLGFAVGSAMPWAIMGWLRLVRDAHYRVRRLVTDRLERAVERKHGYEWVSGRKRDGHWVAQELSDFRDMTMYWRDLASGRFYWLALIRALTPEKHPSDA